MSSVPHTPAEPGELPRLRTAIAQALRGAHTHDYTQGPVGRAVLLLAIPMVLEVALESVFALTDIFFVSRLGESAVAAVGLTESMLAMVYALAMGLGMGAAAVIARRVGERDAEGAARTAVQAVALAAVISVVLGTISFLLAPRLLALMGASPEVIETGSAYARIMLGGQAAVILLFVVNAIFRGAGDPAIAMRVLWLANAINIVLGPMLIFGAGPFPRMGVAGAAVATTFGRSVGAAFALWRLTRPGGHFQVQRRHLVPNPATMRQIVRLSGSTTLQALIGTASWIGLVRIVATFGDTAVAAYTVAIRVVVTAILPSWGLSNAAATMVGQALGAGKPDRAERAVWTACRYNLVFLAVVGAVFVGFARPIVGVFTQDAEVARIAVMGLRTLAAGFPLYAFGLVLTQSFNGAGDTWTPTWINLAIFWAFEIPLAWVLAVTLGVGPLGAFLAVAISFSALAVVSAVVFRRGSWKTKRV